MPSPPGHVDAAPRTAATLNKWQLSQHLTRLAALAEIELVAESHEVAFERIIDAVATILPASAGASIVLWDASTGRFTAGASNVAGQDGVDTAQQVRRSGGTSRWIVDRQETRAVADATVDSVPIGRLTKDFGIGAYAGAPIVLQGESVGVLYALSKEVREWSETDLLFIETMARRAAMAIYNTGLIREARESRDRAEALVRVGTGLIGQSAVTEVLDQIVAGVGDGLGAERCLLVTFDVERELVVQHVTGGPGAARMEQADYAELMHGLTGEAVRLGTTVRSTGDVADEREADYVREKRAASGAGAVIVTPLSAAGGAGGTLTAIRAAGAPDFTADDASLLEAMAHQASMALEHANLIEANRRSATRVAALFRVMEAINSELGLDELLGGLTEVIADTLPADRVTLILSDPVARRVRRVVAGGPGRDRVATEVDFEELWQGLSGWVMRNRRPALSPQGVEDARESAMVRARRDATDAGPVLVVPLFHRGIQLGTLTAINRPGDRDFTQDDVDTAAGMAGHIAVAVSNADLFEELQRLAITDELTGVHNRRHLFDIAEREYRLARRSRTPLSAVLFDLDAFKDINDRYGHGAGDDVLVGVVRRAASVIRDVDVLGRYGGEEFVVVLPGAGADGGAGTAERIRAAVAAEAVETRVGPLEVTVSVGTAVLGPEMTGVEHLFDLADAGMYAAKRLGKNRVEAG